MYYSNISQVLFSRLQVTANFSLYFPIHLQCTCALNKSYGEQGDGACGKLSSISDGLKVLQVGRAGGVSRVKS